VLSNGLFASGQTLPVGVAEHCLVNLDDNHMLLVGGSRSDFSDMDSWIYTVDEDKWEVAPPTNNYYSYLSGICGVVKTSDDVNVVVGSGVSDFFYGDIEIYSQKSNSFESGPNLPYPLQGAASVQYGDTFIVVGGYNSECSCDNSEILYLNTEGANGWSWDVMDVSLSQPRSFHVAFPLEAVSEAICNPDLPTIPPATVPEGSPAALLIIGGQNNKTELIDLATGGAESCVSDVLAPHFSENAMGIFVGDKPTICGGWNWLGNPPEGYDVCWSLDPITGSWEQFTTLPEIRGQSYAAYTSNGGWFMAGGYDGNSYPSNDLDSTLKLVNDESFEKGAQLPFTSKSHCMVGLDDNSYLLVGGERGDYSNNACLYDVEKDKWTCEGDFQNSYVFPVCGTFKKDGETHVLVGTGANDAAYGYTEIYHVKDQSITNGPQMPFGPLHGAYAYPFGDTFVVAGGSKPLEEGAESTDILYFDPITEQFQVMEQKMAIGRSNHLMFALEEFPSGICSAVAKPSSDSPSDTTFTTEAPGETTSSESSIATESTTTTKNVEDTTTTSPGEVTTPSGQDTTAPGGETDAPSEDSTPSPSSASGKFSGILFFVCCTSLTVLML